MEFGAILIFSFNSPHIAGECIGEYYPPPHHIYTKTTATCLPQLDVIQLWVGMNVGIGHADELAPGVGSPLLDGRVQRLQHSNQRHIVLQEAYVRIAFDNLAGKARLHKNLKCIQTVLSSKSMNHALFCVHMNI